MGGKEPELFTIYRPESENLVFGFNPDGKLGLGETGQDSPLWGEQVVYLSVERISTAVLEAELAERLGG